MAPRQRKPENRSLGVANLRVRDGYYSWRHPTTKQEIGLGRNRRQAISQAMEANAHLMTRTPSLLERIAGKHSKRWGDWVDRYEKILAARKLADNTRRTYKSLLVRVRALADADSPIDDITTRIIAEALEGLRDAKKARLAQALRSFLKDCFREAISEGWTEKNPVSVTRATEVNVKRARLSFEVFQRVYEAEKTTWAKNAYALALVSGQSRESIVDAMVKDVRDGSWFNERGKTGARVEIPLTLRLDCFGMSLGDVVKQCRSTGVLSKYLIHQTGDYANSRRGSKIWLDTLSRHFSDTLSTLKIDWGDKNPPTLHEIRSLAERLYKAQGNVNTQELLAHRDAKTTAIYHDSRGDWVKVSVR